MRKLNSNLIYKNFSEPWRDFIDKIPQNIKNEISTLGVATNTAMGLRDFCLVYLHHYKGLSSYEIQDKYKGFFINKNGKSLSYRGVQFIINKYKPVRKHSEALKHRFKTGRIDLKKRKFNYETRKKFHKERDLKYGYKYAVGLTEALRERRISKRKFGSLLGLTDHVISVWSNCRNRVNKNYQEKICKALTLKNEDLFSDTKRIIPKKICYYAPDLPAIMEERKISIAALANAAGINRQRLYVNLKNNTAIVNTRAKKIATALGFKKMRELFTIKQKIDTHKDSLWAVALKAYLLKRGKTEEDLSRYLELRNLTVTRWVNLSHRVDPYNAGLIAEYFNTTIDKIFRGDKLMDGLLRLNSSKKEYYLDIHRIYEECGSLANTGRRLNITREAARQSLEKGASLGLFEYKPQRKQEK
ncbi:MAG: helix-turn-helix transcriptional regulator [Candidatus Omnitrophota bacterium]|jgi:transcriptional regulator with XRE-family HTH domain/predicted DNA-binding protein YlxM (UPF0122 family)